jgi:hypothetical protein
MCYELFLSISFLLGYKLDYRLVTCIGSIEESCITFAKKKMRIRVRVSLLVGDFNVSFVLEKEANCFFVSFGCSLHERSFAHVIATVYRDASLNEIVEDSKVGFTVFFSLSLLLFDGFATVFDEGSGFLFTTKVVKRSA